MLSQIYLFHSLITSLEWFHWYVSAAHEDCERQGWLRLELVNES